MASDRMWCAATWIGGSEEEGACAGENLGEQGMIRDANANGAIMVIVRMMKVRILGQNGGEFTGDILLDDRSSVLRDDGKLPNLLYRLGHQGKDLTRIVITVF